MIVGSLELIEDLINQESYLQAIHSLEQLIEADPDNLNYYWYLGLAYLFQENEELAQEIWLSIFLQGTIQEAERWTSELIDFLEIKVKENIKIKKLGYAKIIYSNITTVQADYKNIELQGSLVEALSLFASDLSFNKNYEDAINIYLEALDLDPDHAISWHALALSYYYLEKYTEAQNAICRAIELNNSSPQNYHVLGLVLQKTQNNLLALEAHNEAIKRNKKFVDAYISMGDINFQQEEIDTALNFYQAALSISDSSVQATIFKKIASIHETLGNSQLVDLNLGYSAYLNKQYKEAIPYFEEFLGVCADSLDVYLVLGNCYILSDQPQAAINLIEKALQLFPNHRALIRLNQSILPIIYNNFEEIKIYRQRFLQKLEDLAKTVESNIFYDNCDQKKENIKAIEATSNYFLGFHGENDLTIQQKYGVCLHSILKQIYPKWCQPIPLKSDTNQRKIRIGYASARLDRLGKLYFGWLKYRDKSKFEIYVYDISGHDKDIKTEKLKFGDNFRKDSDHFRLLPKNIDKICSCILKDELDILIFPEITVELISINLSCLHLAPIQCTSWAHPITSGSPTIDYFLSSDLMEPANGQENYSETLVRLPNLGFALEPLPLRDFEKKRSDFGLRDDVTLYLCCQNMLKYLPQYDYIFPSIAKRNSAAQFVFFDCFLGSVITENFRKRMNETFRQFGLKLEDFCVFSSGLPFNDYLIVQQLSDVFLDTFGWSGGVTTIDAIACGLPIVTCPGEMMRGRQSYGMLKMIGVTETIASTETEYIEIAINLGLNQEWRLSVKEKMKKNRHLLFNDQECVVALETFFEEAIRKHFQPN
jgi:predicted O-linked N-acetylglucosamine transferase (SPINDLY family)